MPGVTETTVGYTGGKTKNPNYGTVCRGDGHTEAIQVEYDPTKVDYDELLDVFYKNCSAESRNTKVQYKSAVWYHNEEQKKKAEAAAQKHGKTGRLDIEEAPAWYDAEERHQKYYEKMRGNRPSRR